MKKTDKNYKSEYFSCVRAIPLMMKFRFSLLKYIFRRGKYPLFIMSQSKGGLLRTYRMQKKLGMSKFVRFNGHYYFSLTMPHWPSKAFDNMVARGGLNITAAGTPAKRQMDTAIIGFTRKCSYKCSHCYEHFNLGETDIVPAETWRTIISRLQDEGVSIVVFSGGEPMMRYDELIDVLCSVDISRSDFHIHTSGFGVTRDKARELKRAGLHAAGVGLDDCDPERHDRLRGYKGAYEQALEAIKLFREAGIFTYINMCPTKELINSGDLMQYMELAKRLNVGVVRWLEPRPCGGFSAGNKEVVLDDDEKKKLMDLYFALNLSADYIDYPMISYEAFYEDPENMGCMMAGNSQLYIDTIGNVQPCVFLPVSFGNILKDEFSVILAKLRMTVSKPVKTVCPSVQLEKIIKSVRDKNSDIVVHFEEIEEEFKAIL